MMKKAPGTSKRSTQGALGTKGIARNNNGPKIGKASPGRTTRATLARKKGC